MDPYLETSSSSFQALNTSGRYSVYFIKDGTCIGAAFRKYTEYLPDVLSAWKEDEEVSRYGSIGLCSLAQRRNRSESAHLD
jgi:hypothetical protein